MEEPGHPEAGLLETFRERALSLRTMSGRLRLATGLALAQLGAAALLVGLREPARHLPATDVAIVGGQLASLSTPVLVVCVAMVCVAWSYLLGGALHGHWAVRLLGLLVFTWAITRDRDVYRLGGAHLGVAIALLAAIWAVGAATWAHDRQVARHTPGRTHSAGLVLTTVGVLALLIAGLHIDAWLSARGQASLLFTGAFTAQLGSLTVFLTPLLLVAGVDFADWAQLSAGRATRLAGAPGSGRLVGAALAVAAATLAWFGWDFRGSEPDLLQDLGWGALALGLAAGLLALLRARMADWRPSVPYAAVAGVGIAGFAITYLALFIPARDAAEAAGHRQGGGIETTLTAYRHEAEPAFSMLHPAAWSASPTPGPGRVLELTGFSIGDPAVADVYSWPVSVLPDPADAARGILLGEQTRGAFQGQAPRLDPAAAQGDERVFDVRGTVATPGRAIFQGRLYGFIRDGRTWVVFGYTLPQLWPDHQSALDRMAASLTGTTAAPEAAPATAGPPGGATDSDRAIAIEVGVFATLLVASLVALRRARRSGWRPFLATTALFLGLVTIWTAVAVPAAFSRLLTGSGHGDPVGFHLEGLQTVAAAALVGCIAVWTASPQRRGRLGVPLRLLLSLTIALWIVNWLENLYGQAQAAGARFSVAQAVVILLALIWDVTMSGESITNRGNRWLPRHSRVLLFLGYVGLVAVAILYFSSLQADGTAVEAQFESEVWPQAGLILLGVPVILTAFAVRIGAWARGAAGAEHR